MAENVAATVILPLELERHIFELAALSRPVSIPNFMRVAWRVKHWVEPLLYRTLVIATNNIEEIPRFGMETFDRIARTKPASLLRDSVRNLIVGFVGVEQIKLILATCTGLENIWIAATGSSTTPLLPAVEGISLRHLYCDFEQLSRFVIAFESFAQPFFSHLTHLELFNGLNDADEDPAAWHGIVGLPHLTHLSFAAIHLIELCPHLLDTCKSLHALIILGFPRTAFLLRTELALLEKDPRFVLMPLERYIQDWQVGVLTGVDYWARADTFIARRTSGEIQGSAYCSDEDSDEDSSSTG
ncbi:hypothetical protein DFH09DRAFT_1284033 [Mycena vulgaris]|nr:hypothetical protein DFH09DRAFT_1284033 [Mycena vulgaris]